MQGLGLLRSLVQALRLWSWGGIACDLVVVNAEPPSYLMALQRELVDAARAPRGRQRCRIAARRPGCRRLPHAARRRALRRRAEHAASPGAGAAQRRRPPACAPRAGMDGAARAGLRGAARDLDFGGRPAAGATAGAAAAPVGEFAPASGEFRFDVSAASAPAAALDQRAGQPGFGAQISEAGGGYTWAVNSRLNQLTAWSNDPVADPPAEWFLLQDRKTLRGLERGAVGLGRRPRGLPRRARPGLQRHQPPPRRRGGDGVVVRGCAELRSSRCGCGSSTAATGRCSCALVGIAEWMMGAQPGRPRSTVHTALHRQRLPDLKEPATSRRRARAQAHRLAVHAARALGRLRRRHGLPGQRRRGGRGRRLDLRPARVFRRARPAWCCPTTSASAAAAGSTPAPRCRRRIDAGAGALDRAACSCSAMRETPDAAQALAASAAAAAAAQRLQAVRSALGRAARRHRR